jgi:antitoxin MazE
METRTTQLAKWGHSLAVRIPKEVVESARFKEGQQVTVGVTKDGAVVVRRARRRYELAALLSGITPKNRHSESRWGPAAGKEVW